MLSSGLHTQVHKPKHTHTLTLTHKLQLFTLFPWEIQETYVTESEGGPVISTELDPEANSVRGLAVAYALWVNRESSFCVWADRFEVVCYTDR